MTTLRRSPLALLLIAYLLLGSLYSIVTPIFEASDELWHYPMVQYVASSGLQLPVQNPAVSTTWRQEGSQPPLYYMLGAILTGWIDTSDLDKVRYLNPHPDIGVIVPDGNANMIIHNAATEGLPWHRTVLAVHLVRFLSVLLGAITVASTYLLTLELFPNRRGLALVAGAFTAFNPMFLFISGSVNNDNLSNALGCLLLLLIVRLVKRRDMPPLRDLVIIGVVTGAGMLAKFNIGFMVILVALSLAIISYRLRNWRPLLIGGLVTGGLTILIAGWWYLRNQQLYGDPTGLNMMINIVGPRNVPANLSQLWSERQTFMMSYWGFFGGVNVPMPDWVYRIFNVFTALAAIGLIIGVIRWLIALSVKDLSGSRVLTNIDSPDVSPRPEGEGPGVRVSLYLGRAFTIIWILVLFVSLLRWTSVTWASQGRLMFSAIAPISMWMVVGLAEWIWVRKIVLVGSTIWIGAVGAIIAPLVITLSYCIPTNNYAGLGSSDCGVCTCSTCYAFQEPGRPQPSLRLYPIEVTQPEVRVGGYYDIKLSFYVLGSFTRDWSVYIHLENSDGLIVAQRDVYLQQGLAATTLLQPNTDWVNYFAVRIPDYAAAPQELTAYMGFYDHKTGERLLVSGPDVKDANQISLGTIKLLPRESSLNVPNPMTINFGDEVELVGYDLSSLSMYPGKKITATFYWRALHPLTTDYHVFTQILEPGTTRVFAGSDKQQLSTGWKPGDIIKDQHTMTVFDDAPPGTWRLQVGIYKSTPESQFLRLHVITPDGGQADNTAQLTRVKITPPLEPF